MAHWGRCPIADRRNCPQRVDDARMRPSRTNSTEGPIDALDQRNGCGRIETVGLGDKLSRVQDNAATHQTSKNGAGDGNREGQEICLARCTGLSARISMWYAGILLALLVVTTILKLGTAR